MKPRYLNVPTFAYEIVTEEETYTIDRQGTITNSAGEVKTFDEILNPPEPKEKLKTRAEQEPVEDTLENEKGLDLDGMELTLPLEGHSGNTLRNLVNMLNSKQHLILMAFETTEPLMDATFAKDLNLKETSSFEAMKSCLSDYFIMARSIYIVRKRKPGFCHSGI